MTNKSIEKFNDLINDTLPILETALNANSEVDFVLAQKILDSSKRIFFTASGSSCQAAKFGSLYLCAKCGLNAQFVSTSELLTISSLSAGDTVFLVSQGFNRSDAKIIERCAKRSGASLILITAFSGESSAKATLRFYPEYNQERIFCRPVGTIASFAVVAQLCARFANEPFNAATLLQSVRDTDIEEAKSGAIGRLAENIRDSSRVIVLASGMIQSSAQNLAVALREGASVSSEFYEIEYYAHGQYAPHMNDFKMGKSITYIVLSEQGSSISVKSMNRISPLLDKTGVSHTIWSFNSDPIIGNACALRAGALLIKALINLTGYDMNHPSGMEENRSFHEVESSFYD